MQRKCNKVDVITAVVKIRIQNYLKVIIPKKRKSPLIKVKAWGTKVDGVFALISDLLVMVLDTKLTSQFFKVH